MVSSVLLPLWYRQSYYHSIVSLITPILSSVLLLWYRQSYYPYGSVSPSTPMVSSVLLLLWYRQSYYPYGMSVVLHL
jgi:hypothetical protein